MRVMKEIKIEVTMVGPKDPTEEMEKVDKKDLPVIKSVRDLRKLLEEENPRFLYGGKEFGLVGVRKEEEEEENEENPDVPSDAGAPTTPDELALEEDNEERVKNSKYPTITGKKV